MLPPVSNGELNEEELESVAGGAYIFVSDSRLKTDITQSSPGVSPTP